MTTEIKKRRTTKPQPPEPPALTSRMDDASGRMFDGVIERLRKRVKEMKQKPQRVADPVWKPVVCEDIEVTREEQAQTPGTEFYGYVLSLLELCDVYLNTQPLIVPKHSWMLSIVTDGRSMPLVEGVATSHEEARRRVEACWRVAMNAIADE